MSKLEKARLSEVDSDRNKVPGTAVDVQFNPTTLKLQLANHISDGDTRGNQVRQYTGTCSTTLSLDLVFDTADEGTTDAPRSVRERTAAVERFVLPAGKPGEKQVPPRVRFQWAELIIDGVIDSITIDLDHFAANGTPLRAKVAVSIKEQDASYQLLKAGPGANTAGGAPAAGGLGRGRGGRRLGGAGDRADGGEPVAEGDREALLRAAGRAPGPAAARPPGAAAAPAGDDRVGPGVAPVAARAAAPAGRPARGDVRQRHPAADRAGPRRRVPRGRRARRRPAPRREAR